MKVKQLPDDFLVEELTNVALSNTGPFGFYRLEKQGWSTPDALAAIRRRWKLQTSRLSFGGLKDRHARTIQYFSIFRGPQRRLHHQGISVEYLGQVAEAYTSRALRANRFQLTLRALTGDQRDHALIALNQVRREGLPNYFDDQRFGSINEPGEFVARLMVRGQYEEALRLALTGPYAHDRAAQKKEKVILREHWGDWDACAERLARADDRAWLDYLRVYPADFRGALVRLHPDLRGFYLSAYQSHLWNRILARWLETHCHPDQLFHPRLRLGTIPMHYGLDDAVHHELADLQIPLPTARWHPDSDDPRRLLVDSILAEDGLSLDQLKLKGFREMFFSKGERAALLVPAFLIGEVAEDDRHVGLFKLLLSFELPPGAYATMIVKRITAFGVVPSPRLRVGLV